MTSQPRSYPSDKPPEANKRNVIQENQLIRQSNQVLRQESPRRIQNALQSEIEAATNQVNSVREQISKQAESVKLKQSVNKKDSVVKQEGPMNAGGPVAIDNLITPNPPKKYDNIIKKVNLVNPDSSGGVENASPRDSPITPFEPIKAEDLKKLDDLIKHGPLKRDDNLPKHYAQAKKCAECGHILPPETCKECGQAVPPKLERCSGCGQIIPETCNACGQVIPLDWGYHSATGHSRSLDHDLSCRYYDKWCYDGASCRATTSRKLSRSSGDCDSDSCSSQCSCRSNDYGSNVYEKPCVIADSATLLRKSKWVAFKNCFRRLGRKRHKCHKKRNRKSKSKEKKSRKADDLVTVIEVRE